LIHDYRRLVLPLVWEVVEEDLGLLDARVRAILASLESEEG
jgi:uncharacterized protein with HEPN domain